MIRARLAIAVCGIFLGGCSRTGTALLLEIDGSAVPGVEQFHIAGHQEGALVFGPAIRPELVGGALEGKQTVRVLLSDEVVGASVSVRVDGLRSGQSVGFGEALADPVRNREVRVGVALAPSEPACADCAGCCNRGNCVTPSVAACGAGGVGCFACDPVLADRCSPNGRCECGAGTPQCSRLLGADRCDNGQCVCGTTVCGPGLECANGLCRCTDKSCPGCCTASNQCMVGNTINACGAGGSPCTVCDGGLACLGGRCTTPG